MYMQPSSLFSVGKTNGDCIRMQSPLYFCRSRISVDRKIYFPPKESSPISTAAPLVAMMASILPMVTGSTA